MERIEVKFATDDVDAKTGEFSGYGAVFGNVDSYGDVIAAGAFKATLRDWKKEKKLPPMLVQHGGWMMGDMDALPVGIWTDMVEDETGLKVSGRIINLDTDRGKTIHGAMREGALDGLSIGYRPKKFTLGTKPDEPRRKLEAVDLIEVSVVTFPANGLARVSAVKAADRVKTIRDFEDFLRDAGGFSRAAAKAIASHGFKGADPRDEDVTDLAALLRRNVEIVSRS
jgi:uncharacterized protein